MKVSLFLTSLLASQATAFAPQQSAASSTALNLFGGNKGGDDKKGPGGMMDQLAMFKKAQEVATKKKELDAELANMEFEGSGADGKVKVSFKYVVRVLGESVSRFRFRAYLSTSFVFISLLRFSETVFA